MPIVRKPILTLIASACAIAAGVPVQAQDEHYFDCKTITVYVGRTPGSGADLSVRVFVEFWQRHIPGGPTMVVRNVPGGGGTRVWNFGAEIAGYGPYFNFLISHVNRSRDLVLGLNP